MEPHTPSKDTSDEKNVEGNTCRSDDEYDDDDTDDITCKSVNKVTSKVMKNGKKKVNDKHSRGEDDNDADYDDDDEDEDDDDEHKSLVMANTGDDSNDAICNNENKGRLQFESIESPEQQQQQQHHSPLSSFNLLLNNTSGTNSSTGKASSLIDHTRENILTEEATHAPIHGHHRTGKNHNGNDTLLNNESSHQRMSTLDASIHHSTNTSSCITTPTSTNKKRRTDDTTSSGKKKSKCSCFLF